MKLSIQTVCVVFGVTLVHLFAITALTPVTGEWTDPHLDIAERPELETDSAEDLARMPDVAEQPIPAVKDAVALPARNLADSEVGNSLTAESAESSAFPAADLPGELHTLRPVPRS